MKVGDLYLSNLWGMMEVIEYVSSINITVKFTNTGFVATAQKVNIQKGLVKDWAAFGIQVEKEREARAKIQRDEADKRKEKIDAITKVFKDEKKRLWQIRVHKHTIYLRDLELKREKAFPISKSGDVLLWKSFIDKLGDKYTVVDRKAGASSWLVRYKESGNYYWKSECYVENASIVDSDRADTERRLKLLYKLEAAKFYEENRDDILARATQYQKDNVERTRVRNRNRRARRINAEGTHTVEETDNLYKEQEGLCACCGVQLSDSTKELDHIMPLVLGGSNYIENLQYLCGTCNNSKSGSHPEDWAIYSKSESFLSRLAARRNCNS